MRIFARLIGGVALAVALPVTAQMMQPGDGMGGGRRTMINLISPADSPIQIRRGTVMFGMYMTGMGQNPMGMGMTGSASNGVPATQVVLRLMLTGVSDAQGLITSTDNVFTFRGQLATPGDGTTPVAIDQSQSFALSGGRASVQVPVNLPTLTGPATISIDEVFATDGHGTVFALPGITVAQPTPQGTPHPTPGEHCASDSDCNDGDPNTTDICMPMGCQHMSGHMGHGM